MTFNEVIANLLDGIILTSKLYIATYIYVVSYENIALKKI